MTKEPFKMETEDKELLAELMDKYGQDALKREIQESDPSAQEIVRVTVRMTNALKEAIDGEARGQEVSQNDLIVGLIKEGLRQQLRMSIGEKVSVRQALIEREGYRYANFTSKDEELDTMYYLMGELYDTMSELNPLLDSLSGSDRLTELGVPNVLYKLQAAIRNDIQAAMTKEMLTNWLDHTNKEVECK